MDKVFVVNIYSIHIQPLIMFKKKKSIEPLINLVI